MKKTSATFSRRQMLGLLGAGVAASPRLLAQTSSPMPPANTDASRLARDEAFWKEVGSYYDRTEGIINLEHGYWGKMARPVQEQYLAATQMVNKQLSYYARRDYGRDAAESVRRVARALDVEPEEIVLTRNATESIHNLIRQYQRITADDALLYADIDYPSFQQTMQWLADSAGATGVMLKLPPRASQQNILDLYRSAFDEHPNLKLILLTHVSNQHGLVVPVAAITQEARRRGIDVICDSAQSWGLLDFTLPELGVDWAGFNLHKWIGSPVGVGALYMRRGTLEKISPYPGERDPDNTRAATRVHTATSNFAAILAVPAALDFHEALGGANKEARLRYLRGLWTQEADTMPHIEVLGGADEDSWTGMASFRLRDQSSAAEVNALQKRLEQEFGIFTVARYELGSGACIRVTPQVFTTPDELAQLVSALKRLQA
ncbi:MAG: aminotransferase class V-fold PLP-dependent enzyme [Pseudomonadales bacterium]|nr:aminotransferase class V-fold PLP-dependent enzyme [Pseudomonadales bacterium]